MVSVYKRIQLQVIHEHRQAREGARGVGPTGGCNCDCSLLHATKFSIGEGIWLVT